MRAVDGKQNLFGVALQTFNKQEFEKFAIVWGFRRSDHIIINIS